MVITRKTSNTKYWQGCGEVGCLIYCWWECKIVQLFWKIVCLPQNIELSYDLKIPPLDVYQLSSVQLLSRVWLCEPMNCSTPGLPVHTLSSVWLCDPMDRSTPGLPAHHQWLWVSGITELPSYVHVLWLRPLSGQIVQWFCEFLWSFSVVNCKSGRTARVSFV